MPAQVVAYPFAEGAPQSKDFTVRVNGSPTGVYANGPHSYALFSFDGGGVEVEIHASSAVKGVTVRPRAANIHAKIEGAVIRFTLDRPRKLSVELVDGPNLFLFADAIDKEPPQADTPGVIYFGPGYHDLKGKDLHVGSNQTLYVAGGAYLGNGNLLVVRNARRATIRGRGVLNVATRVENSRHVLIEGVVIHTVRRMWMNKIDASQHVTYRNVKVLCEDDSVVNNDGFDVMSGNHHIVIADAFVRANDDVLAIKHHPGSVPYWASRQPISHVVFRDCVVWNLQGGNVFEIGVESIGPRTGEVTVQNCDVIHSQWGAVFDIAVPDAVLLENIVYRDIRVEEDHRMLLDLQLDHPRYKVGVGRASARGLYFRDIAVRGEPKPSDIGGFDHQHRFDGIHFDRVTFDGRAAASLEDLSAKARYAEGITFNEDRQPAPDTTPPRVLEAHALPLGVPGRVAIYVQLSEEVERDAAEMIEHYQLSGGARCLSATLSPNDRQVVLLVEGWPGAGDATLRVRGLKDFDDNALADATIGVGHRTRWTASEGFGEHQGRMGWYYEQVNPLKVQLFAGRPDLLFDPSYWLANHAAGPDGGRWLGHDGGTVITRAAQQPGPFYHAVRSWMAPGDGTLRVAGSAAAGADTAEGAGPAEARVLHNPGGTPDEKRDAQLWHATLRPGESGEHTLTVAVRAGDVLRFVVARADTARPVSVRWKPSVEYVSGTP